MFRLTRSFVLALALGLVLLAFQAPTTPVAAQDPGNADQPVKPIIVETARLKFISSSGDFGGILKHPDGTARAWNFNPDSRQMQLFDPGYGRRLWGAAVPGNIDIRPGMRPTLIGGGSLMLWTTRDRVVAFSGTDGSYRWTVTNDNPQFTWEILPVNALPDRVVLQRAQTDPRTNALKLLEVRVLDASTGKEAWRFEDPKAVTWPQIWRGYIIQSTVNEESGENEARVRDLRDGAVVWTSDFVPNQLSDSTILTVRYRKGLERSKYLLPD